MGREREGCQVFTYAPDPTDTSATVRLTGNARGDPEAGRRPRKPGRGARAHARAGAANELLDIRIRATERFSFAR